MTIFFLENQTFENLVCHDIALTGQRNLCNLCVPHHSWSHLYLYAWWRIDFCFVHIVMIYTQILPILTCRKMNHGESRKFTEKYHGISNATFLCKVSKRINALTHSIHPDTNLTVNLIHFVIFFKFGGDKSPFYGTTAWHSLLR